MYLCVCYPTTEEDLKEVVSAGYETLTEIESACGAASGCGRCRKFVEEGLAKVLCDKSARTNVQSGGLVK